MEFTESQRRRRGHAFLPPAPVLRSIPKLYDTEKVPAGDKMIPLHYFSASGDWYIAELDTGSWTAFGYAKLASHPEGAEWGYISLHELEQVKVHGGLVIVERDMYWTPRSFRETGA